jgi:acid phosphatase
MHRISLNDKFSYYGQLTNLGRYRMTLLGQNIRDVYINRYKQQVTKSNKQYKRMFFFRLKFLPDTFDEKSVYLRSTDYVRTQESIQQMVTVGLYPKEKRPQDFEFKLNIR